MDISLAVTTFVAIWILSKFLGVSLRGPIRALGGLISLVALMFAHVVSITVILIIVAGLAAVTPMAPAVGMIIARSVSPQFTLPF